MSQSHQNKTCAYYDDTYILLLSTQEIFKKYLPHWILTTYQRSHNFETDTLSNKPDVLLLDFSMPKYGGDTIVTTMKPRLPNITYIVYTADIAPHNIELYQELGFDSLIPKDIENRDFVNRFKKIASGEMLWL